MLSSDQKKERVKKEVYEASANKLNTYLLLRTSITYI
jgi:hypothetical protein